MTINKQPVQNPGNSAATGAKGKPAWTKPVATAEKVQDVTRGGGGPGGDSSHCHS